MVWTTPPSTYKTRAHTHTHTHTHTYTPRLLNEAHIELLAFQRALREYVLSVDDAYGKQFEVFNVGFEGR